MQSHKKKQSGESIVGLRFLSWCSSFGGGFRWSRMSKLPFSCLNLFSWVFSFPILWPYDIFSNAYFRIDVDFVFLLSSRQNWAIWLTWWISYRKHELLDLRESMKSPRVLSSSGVLCAQCCWCLWLDNPFLIFSEIYLQTLTLIFCKVYFDSFFFFMKAISTNANHDYISDCKTKSTKYIINIILRQILNLNQVSNSFSVVLFF